MIPETDAEREARIQRALAGSGVPAAIKEPPSPQEIAQAKVKAVRMLAETAVRLNPAEKELALWCKVEDNARANLAVAIEHGLPEADAYREQLGQALMHQGRFTEAVVYDPTLAEIARQMEHARARQDDKWCTCDEYTVPVYDRDGKEIGARQMPKYGLVAKSWDHERGMFVNLVRCWNCGDCNLTPNLPDSLSRMLSLSAEFPGKNEGPDHAVFGE